ncbi:lipocalin family protein [Candidatus Bipolaricaulota bacterium]
MRKGASIMVLVCLGIGVMAADSPVSVVESVNVTQYMGLWYSIASIPTSFERQCAQGTTAEYSLLENGRIQVINTCYDSEGNKDVARGQAWLPNESETSKLKVSFVRFLGLWWFGAPYWVIDLAPDYTYAVVGHPSRKYGWILSRTPTLPDDVLAGIFERLESQGYHSDDFRRMDQSINLP